MLKKILKQSSFWLAIGSVMCFAIGTLPTGHGIVCWIIGALCVGATRYVARWEGRQRS